MSRRLGAGAAILGGGASLGAATYAFVVDFPAGVVVLGCVIAALAVAWYGVLRRGARRVAAAAAVLILIATAAAVMAGNGNGLVMALIIGAFAVALAGARAAFRPARSLPPAPNPIHPVLFVNPRSGDGRAARTGLVEKARGRGIETIEMAPGDDLEQLARGAVRRGADALAMAGGDGSQAVVAAIAAEHGLAYACIPSGTRNHFALDLGVDREDVIGALEAFTDGGERQVDLAEVNGRVFVNNVSLGVYAEAVSRQEYRGSKLRTLLETLTDTLGPGGGGAELRWRMPMAPSSAARRWFWSRTIPTGWEPPSARAPGRAWIAVSSGWSTFARRRQGGVRGHPHSRAGGRAAGGRGRRAGHGGRGRRVGVPRAAAAVHGPPTRPQGEDRARTSRRVALGRNPEPAARCRPAAPSYSVARLRTDRLVRRESVSGGC